MGTRQSGLPSFLVANIISDFKIFECARDDAKEILKEPKSIENIIIMSEVKKSITDFRLS
jgi:RecG-like helicase